MCPSGHWLPEHSLVTQHEIYSLWAWWSQILSAGRAITSEDQCTSNQALPYHEIKGHPSVHMYLALQAVWDFVTDNAQYTGETMKYIFKHNSFYNNQTLNYFLLQNTLLHVQTSAMSCAHFKI